MLPKYYFKETADVLFLEAFIKNNKLEKDVGLLEISNAFDFDISVVYEKLSKDFGITINTKEQASTYINDERYRRFNKLIDKRFSDEVLIKLLDYFEKRNDKKIEELVTDESNDTNNI